MRFKAKSIHTLFQHNRGWVILGTICIFITSFSIAKSADYIQKITDHIQTVGTKGLAFFVFMACFTQISHYITKYGLAVSCRNLSFKLCKKLRVNLMDYWNKTPFAAFERKQVGQYLSIAQNDTENASFYIYVVFSRIGMSVFTVLMTLPFMLRIDVSLTVVVMAISFGFGAINQQILKKIKHNESNARDAQEVISNTVISGFDSADSIKTYNAVSYMGKLYSGIRRRYSKALLNVEGIDSSRNAFYTIVNNTTLYGSIIFLAYQTLRGNSTLGQTLSFNILLTQALVSIEMIYRWSGSVVRCNASWERIEKEMLEPVIEQMECEKRVARKLSIKDLSYSYDQKNSVFETITMDMEQGNIYCINGGSGSGKTTLIKCLLGLYPTNNATYTVDESPVDQQQVAGLISYVPSEHYLFQGSIFENLALGNPVSKDECMNFADALGIGDWIRTLPKKLDTAVETGGGNFSGGQRQALCILRAILFHRPILILDEPFSALDQSREADLSQLLSKIKNDHIILLTSHRDHTLNVSDYVFQL